MLEDQSDEVLAGLISGEPRAYEIISGRHRKNIINFICAKFYVDPPAAEDIVQDALLKAYLNSAKFDPNRKWKTWIYTIAFNCALNYLRYAKHDSLDLFEQCLFDENSNPERSIDRIIQNERLHAAMLKIDPELREILRLIFWADLDFKEISKKLRLPARLLKAKIEQAKNQLALVWNALEPDN